jgi:hypothetical protein
MRRLVASVILAVTAGVTGAAAGAFTPAKTNACLKAAGARVVANSEFSYPEIQSEFLWRMGAPLDFGTGVSIFFTRNPSAAVTLEGRLVHVAEAFGWTQTEILAALGRRGNVVWGDVTNVKPVSPAHVALLERCLR